MPDLADISRDEFKRMAESAAATGDPRAMDNFTYGRLQSFMPAPMGPPAPRAQLTQQVPSSLIEPFGKRPNVNLDMITGVPASLRAKLSFEANEFNQVKILAREYGLENVDKNPQGGWVIRNQTDGHGGIQDILVNPPGIDKGDIASFAADLAPTIGGIAAGLLTRGKVKNPGAISKFLQKMGPLAKVEIGSGAMAVGTELTGAAQDLIARHEMDLEANPSEIAQARLWAAAEDFAFGNVLAGGAKVASKALAAGAGILQIPVGKTASMKAAQELQSATKAMETSSGVANPKGVKYPLTPGQISESRVLLRGESILSRRLGSAGAFDKFIKDQQASEDELRRVFLGFPRTMTDEELAASMPKADFTGEAALGRLRGEAEKLTGTVEAARANLQKTGTAEVQKVAKVDLKNQLNVSDVGKAARTRTRTDFESFKTKMGDRYDAFLSKPEIQSRTVSGDQLSDAAKSIEKTTTPAVEKTVTEQTAILDQFGRPGETYKQVTERLDAFVNAKVRGFVDTLKGLKGGRVGINDLKVIRTSIDDAIAEGVAIPGTNLHQLKQLRSSVSSAIESGLEGMPNRSLLEEWKALSSDYEAGIERFDRTAIRKMLVPEGETGSLGNAEIAESIMGDTSQALDRYNEFKQFFGVSSPEFRNIQQAAREQSLERTLGDTTGFIEGARLRAAIRNTRPEVASELFGANKVELAKIGEILQKTEGKLDTDELYRLMQQKSLTATKINDLRTAEIARSIAFNNKLINAAAKGMLDAETIKPSEFVRYALDMDPKDAQRVMGVLSDRPDIVEDIRQLEIEDLFTKVRAGMPGRELVSTAKLRMALGTETQHRTWEAIIGKDALDGIKKLANTVASRETSAQEFASGGSLGGAIDISQMAFRPEPKVLKELAVRYLIGFAYSRPLKRAVTNLFTPQDQGRFLNALISSTPFIESVKSRFEPDVAIGIMAEYRDMIDPIEERALQLQGKIKGNQPIDPSTLSRDEFEQYMRNVFRE